MHLILQPDFCHVLMSEDRSALGILGMLSLSYMSWHMACGHVILENHLYDKTPDDKIGHVLIVIYCSWTSSLAQPPKNFGHLWWPAGPLCIAGGKFSIQMVIVRKLIDRKIWLMHENEANKQYFAIIRWLAHLGDWITHSMTKTVKIGQNWLSNGLLQIFPKFEKLIPYLKSAPQTASEKCGEQNFGTKVKKGITLIYSSVDSPNWRCIMSHNMGYDVDELPVSNIIQSNIIWSNLT